MSNYILGTQKKNKIFHKRERELIHAIRNDNWEVKITKSITRLREAKIQAIWAQDALNNLCAEEKSEFKDDLINKWNAMSDDEILAKYRKRKEKVELKLIRK